MKKQIFIIIGIIILSILIAGIYRFDYFTDITSDADVIQEVSQSQKNTLPVEKVVEKYLADDEKDVVEETIDNKLSTNEDNITTSKNLSEKIEDIQSENIPTPPQMEGPYYPIKKPQDRDENLRLIEDSTVLAAGTAVRVYGKLFNTKSVPLEKHLVEIWQADSNGVYEHPDDPKYTTKDKNFQSYGEYITDSDGKFYFETVLPGHYDDRPRHIHIRVKDEFNTELLTTQLYFYGDKYFDTDAIYYETENKELLVMKLYESREAKEASYKIGGIHILLP